MTGTVQADEAGADPLAAPAQPVAFGFNLGKIPGQGEDSDPILRAGRSLALVAVFDGMGGAGGTVYETPDGPRTGAYIASRVARDVVEQRMAELLRPDWYLDGEAAAEEIHRCVTTALQERLAELNAPRSGLRSKLLRALPTTMALVALQRRSSAEDQWVAHVLWAGDSRAYVFEPNGLRQLTTDDLREPGDAMQNLRHDSVVGNAMSADVEFHVSYRAVELEAPFLLVCATDGCFGYVPSPMHFEHLVLDNLSLAADPHEWSSRLQTQITAVTGDDAAMAALAIGVEFRQLQELFATRTQALAADYLRPLDDARQTVAEAEAALEAARHREAQTTSELWQRYKPGYEHHLNAAPEGATSGRREVDNSELRDLWTADPGAADATDNGEEDPE